MTGPSRLKREGGGESGIPGRRKVQAQIANSGVWVQELGVPRGPRH